MTLKQQLMKAIPELTEDDFGNHYSDLYVVAYESVRKWLKQNYQYYNSIRTFMGNKGARWNGDGKICIEIPFAHEEYFKRR